MKRLSLHFLLLILPVFYLKAQDTLPDFSVKNAGGNRIIVSWINTYKVVKQISIQRSFDSLYGYKSIMTVPDPATPQNGYVDINATNDRMFYRIYIQFDKGVYLISAAKRPIAYTTDDALVKRNSFTDKMNKLTGSDSVSIPKFGLSTKVKPELFVASLHVYTLRDGYVRVNLPDDEHKNYSIKFFEQDNSFLFELKDIKERTFRIDKANFYHAGWFKFELYENGRLSEKHKFYIEKDF